MSGNVLLCDLDGTLIDKDAGFALWADRFASARGLTQQQRRRLDDAVRAHRQREPFFDTVVEHLSLRERPEALWAEYRQQMPELAPSMPGVVSALTALRAGGWRTAVVSNGRSDNQRGKLNASGLARLFDAVLISEEAGIREPDPAIFAAAVEACTSDRPGRCRVDDRRRPVGRCRRRSLSRAKHRLGVGRQGVAGHRIGPHRLVRDDSRGAHLPARAAAFVRRDGRSAPVRRLAGTTVGPVNAVTSSARSVPPLTSPPTARVRPPGSKSLTRLRGADDR
jgi:FMN phosphatase YigB (HAD superfamily)